MSDTTLDGGLDTAILADTFWTELPDPTLRRMLLGSQVRRIAARGAVFGLGDPEPRAGILLAGTARAFLAAADGRQLTVRYTRRGAFLARRSYLLGGHSPIAIHAVTDLELLELDARPFLRLVETEPTVARAVLAELSRHLEDVYATVADSAFGTMREKISRHLLALSADGREGHRRIAPITQQALADGVGTRREVAARVLRDLRREGIVATTPGAIEILDPARLSGSLGSWQTPPTWSADAAYDIETVIESSPNAVVVVDVEGQIAFVNGVAESSFGWRKEELIGRPVEMLIPDAQREEHMRHRDAFLADPVPRPMSLRSGLCGCRRDGTEFPISVGLSVVETQRGTMVLATVVDRTAG